MTLGSAAAPVVLVAAGNIVIGAGSNVVLNGLVYSARRGAGRRAAATRSFNGVFIAEGEAAGADEGRFTIIGAPRIAFDPAATDVLKQGAGAAGARFRLLRPPARQLARLPMNSRHRARARPAAPRSSKRWWRWR